MRVALLLLSIVSASAQTVTFVPQGTSRIPFLTEHTVYVESPTDVVVPGLWVLKEALHQGIRPYTYVPLQQYIDELNKRSGWRYALVVCQVGGLVETALISSDLTIIKERAKVVIPLAASGCTIAKWLVDREYKPVSIPLDMMQPLIAVPAGRPTEFALWAQ